MSLYKLIKETSCAESEQAYVTHEFFAVTITDLLEQFENFLRGCGFSFDGHIEIVEDEDESQRDE